MARGFSGGSRGGFGSRGGGSRSSGSRGSTSRSSSSRSGGGSKRSSGSNGSKPKGQVKSGKAVQYAIKGPRGGTKYVGTTNNPRRRAAEHRDSGKLKRGDKLVVESRPVPRGVAEKMERGKLASHRDSHRGRNPKHNTTNDGQFHS